MSKQISITFNTAVVLFFFHVRRIYINKNHVGLEKKVFSFPVVCLRHAYSHCVVAQMLINLEKKVFVNTNAFASSSGVGVGVETGVGLDRLSVIYTYNYFLKKKNKVGIASVRVVILYI